MGSLPDDWLEVELEAASRYVRDLPKYHYVRQAIAEHLRADRRARKSRK